MEIISCNNQHISMDILISFQLLMTYELLYPEEMEWTKTIFLLVK